MSGYCEICGDTGCTDQHAGAQVMREEFEKRFPVPAGVYWHDEAEKYAASDRNSLHKAERHRAQWEAWQAAHPTPDAGRVAELERSLRIANDALRSASAEVVTQGQRIAALESQLADSREREGRLREALEDARLFIRNGVELGYIRMPDADTPDPAHTTLPRIEAALAADKEETK